MAESSRYYIAGDNRYETETVEVARQYVRMAHYDHASTDSTARSGNVGARGRLASVAGAVARRIDVRTRAFELA